MIQREHPRTKVLWNAKVRSKHGDSVKCEVLDIAAGGAKIRTDAHFLLGSTVEFMIIGWPGGAIPSKVLWRRGNHAGLSFLDDPHAVQKRLDEAMLVKLAATA